MRPNSAPSRTKTSRALAALALGTVAATLLVGCPAPEPKTPPQPVTAPKPKPKPKPKCEKLSEKCKARKSTRLQIPNTEYAFQPPKGWTYAKAIEDNPAIAEASKDGAVIVADSVEMEKSRFKRGRQRDDLASFLFEQVGAKIIGKRPQHTGKIETKAGQKATLREYERSTRGDKNGSALVVTIELKQRMIVVAIFAPAAESDEADDSNIMGSILGLRKMKKAAAAGKETEDSKPSSGRSK
jgi:hypothetical protein